MRLRGGTYLVNDAGELRGRERLSLFAELHVSIVLCVLKLSRPEVRGFNGNLYLVWRAGSRSTRDDSSSKAGAAVFSNGKRDVCQALKKRGLSNRLRADNNQLICLSTRLNFLRLACLLGGCRRIFLRRRIETDLWHRTMRDWQDCQRDFPGGFLLP